MDIVSRCITEAEALRDIALNHLRAHRPVLVRRIQRAFLRALLDHGADTTDVVRDAVPIPEGTDARVVGAAVKALAADFKLIAATGSAKSRRPKAHARKLDVWTIRDRSAAEAWLLANPELPEPETDAAPTGAADPFAFL